MYLSLALLYYTDNHIAFTTHVLSILWFKFVFMVYQNKGVVLFYFLIGQLLLFGRIDTVTNSKPNY